MTDQGPLGRPPRGASVPGGAPRGAGPQLINALNFDFDFAARYSVPIGAPEQPQYASNPRFKIVIATAKSRLNLSQSVGGGCRRCHTVEPCRRIVEERHVAGNSRREQ